MAHPATVERSSRSLAPLKPDGTLIAVIEMNESSWLVAGIVPRRAPAVRKLTITERIADQLQHRGRGEPRREDAGSSALRCLEASGMVSGWRAAWGTQGRPPVTHASSVAVTREPRRAKTDRVDPSCSNPPLSPGCAANVITARWWRSRRPRTKMPSGPTASARASSESKLGLSTE